MVAREMVALEYTNCTSCEHPSRSAQVLARSTSCENMRGGGVSESQGMSKIIQALSAAVGLEQEEIARLERQVGLPINKS